MLQQTDIRNKHPPSIMRNIAKQLKNRPNRLKNIGKEFKNRYKTE